MILVDTAIWVDHFRVGNPRLVALLDGDQVLTHPFVIGELAVGNLRPRDAILRRLHRLLVTRVASDREVLEFIHQHRLYGLGIGYIDCHLLAAVRLTPGAWFWTRDKRLLDVAARLGLAAQFPDSANGPEP